MHPYYGYVHCTNNDMPEERDALKAENLGLHGSGTILNDHYDDVYNIVITGGSVANIFYGTEHDAVQKIFEQHKEITKEKKVQVFGFTNWGYKEPQQLIIINDLIAQGAHFDLVMNIDGLNEMIIPLYNNLQNNVYPFYPLRWDLATRDDGESSYGQTKIELERTKQLRLKLADFIDSIKIKFFAKEAFWLFCDDLLYSRKQRLLNELKDAKVSLFYGNNLTLNSAGKAVVGTPNLPSRDMAPWLLLEWARASVLLHNAILAQGGRYFHFLQPNQYVTGSKPFTPHEKLNFVNKESFLYKNVNPSYEMLREGGKVLRDDGIDFVDASQVFATTHDELYINDCCHFNKLGNDIFFDFIMRHIIESLTNDSSQHKKYISVATTGNTIVQIDSIKKLYYEKYENFKFDIFSSSPLVTTTNILPQETPARRERWATRQTHSLSFYFPAATDLQLTCDFLNLEKGQQVTFSINGQEIDRITNCVTTIDPFDTTNINRVRMTLPAKRGYNTINIACSKYNAKDRDFSILYRRLELEAATPPSR